MLKTAGTLPQIVLICATIGKPFYAYRMTLELTITMGREYYIAMGHKDWWKEILHVMQRLDWN